MTDQGLRCARRSFLSRLAAAVTAAGGAFGVGAQSARAQAVPAGSAKGWQPARHAEDDWLEQVAAQHRLFCDTTTPEGIGLALRFADNYFTANQTGYGVAASDLAVVICLRHRSTPFAYDEAMWAKYGGPISERAEFTDPRTKQAPAINVYRVAGPASMLPNNGATLDALIERGVRLAVCQMSTRGYAATIAGKTGGKVDYIYKEITQHLLPNARMVPAGIVAVNRAQERGYSLAYVG
jgi:intracellular sulfur oxidation DsrE/DsrF family protein